jgi:hypothetical protein
MLEIGRCGQTEKSVKVARDIFSVDVSTMKIRWRSPNDCRVVSHCEYLQNPTCVTLKSRSRSKLRLLEINSHQMYPM